MQLPPGVEEIGSSRRTDSSSLPAGIEPLRETPVPVVNAAPTNANVQPNQVASGTGRRPTEFSYSDMPQEKSWLTGLGEMLDTVANPKSLTDLTNLIAPSAVDDVVRYGMKLYSKLKAPVTKAGTEVLKDTAKVRDIELPPIDSTDPAEMALQKIHDDIPVDPKTGMKIYNPEGKLEFDFDLQEGKPLATPKVPPVNKEGIYSSSSLKPKSGDPLVPDKIDPVQKMKDALKTARPIRAEQEALYTTEKGKRIREATSSIKEGEEWAKEYMGALKGEYPKVEYDGVKFEQPDVDNLFSQVKTSTRLTDWERPHAITGLGKVLTGSAIPQDSEITVLKRVFGDDLVKPMTRMNLVNETLAVPKAMQAAYDLSAPFRQGLGLIHKKAWWTSWDDMIKSAGSENFFQGLQESLRETPHFELGQKVGLALTDLTSLTGREEQIMSSLVEKIPLVGRGVRASNRAYTGFLNKLRSDVFNDLINTSIKAGLDPRKDETLAAEIAGFVNNATGRGDLGQLEKYATGLNNALFSPRFIASRVNMIRSVVPYIGAPPSVRKEYLKSLAAIATAGTSLTNLARLAGAKIESDPASSDFGKAKIGNTRFDPYGGFQQYLTLFSRIKPSFASIPGMSQSNTDTPLDQITGFLSAPGNRFKSSTAKPSSRFAEYDLGSQFGGSTRKDAIEDFGVNKLAPLPRFVYQFLDQSKDRPFNIPREAVSLFIPMVMQDIYEVSKEDPELLPLTLPSSIVGIGSQSYGSK